ncbi:16S rRNA (guanine(527)-N(7))-methyltransferase RsmG [uncultured Amnibacterium sp.]|uniref:16S rRNA (guanine(527)-N(7))-methyltransferase RsmG n=1 Tax=uncultured Amnibacterium sp. TaxID=1631851 RepID=UPI0035CA62A8
MTRQEPSAAAPVESLLEAEPPVAQQVFGSALPLIRRYTADLADRGVVLGLIGPREPARLWSRHVLNCGLLASAVPPGSTVADVGSGAGLPGLVLAAARPDLVVTLIEPMQRRTDWLIQEAERLGLASVTVLRARAEDVAAGTRFDVVTARAVGALTTLLPLTAPLARPGGRLLLMKGATAADELAAAAGVVRRLGLTEVGVNVLGTGMALEPTRVVTATVRTT